MLAGPGDKSHECLLVSGHKGECPLTPKPWQESRGLRTQIPCVEAGYAGQPLTHSGPSCRPTTSAIGGDQIARESQPVGTIDRHAEDRIRLARPDETHVVGNHGRRAEGHGCRIGDVQLYELDPLLSRLRRKSSNTLIVSCSAGHLRYPKPNGIGADRPRFFTRCPVDRSEGIVVQRGVAAVLDGEPFPLEGAPREA
jgi:hypothetical protein